MTLSSNFISCLPHVGVLRPSPSCPRVATTHSRHVLGVFPDAHRLSARSNGVELWRLTATLRQSTTTGRFQLVHLKHVEQSLSDSSSCAMAHQPNNSARVPHPLSKTVFGCTSARQRFSSPETCSFIEMVTVFYARKIDTLTMEFSVI